MGQEGLLFCAGLHFPSTHLSRSWTHLEHLNMISAFEITAFSILHLFLVIKISHNIVSTDIRLMIIILDSMNLVWKKNDNHDWNVLCYLVGRSHLANNHF